MNARRADQSRSRLGLAVNPYAQGQTVGQILEAYERAGFPDRHRRQRNQKTLATEVRSLAGLKRILGELPVARIGHTTCDQYADKRRHEMAENGRDGSRTVDMELQTLSNAFRYAVRAGIALANPLLSGRPRYRSAGDVRRSRDCAPENGTEIHRLAFALADDSKGEVLAWQLCFSALTGCRTNEILRLRTDAGPRKPGCLEGDWLWIERSKKGVNPFVLLHEDLRACIKAHRVWLKERYPDSPWYFPSPIDPAQPVDITSLSHAMTRVTKALGLGHRTPHGLRAYFVTMRRSQGISDGQIAAEIGDRSVQLIATTYGQIPPSWRGGPGLSWRPTNGEKAFWDTGN